MKSLPRQVFFSSLVLVSLWLLIGCGSQSASVAGVAKPTLPEKAPAALEPSRQPSIPQTTSAIQFSNDADRLGVRFTFESGRDAVRSYPTANGAGVALLDFDSDGLLDIYFGDGCRFPLQPDARPNGALFRQLAPGRFELATNASGLAFPFYSQGTLSGDVNNDGFPDLLLSGYGGNQLYINQGDGTFALAKAENGFDDGRWGTGMALVDCDLDGNLDLYRAAYAVWSLDNNPWCGDQTRGIRIYCRPSELKPERHIFLANQGDGRWKDNTRPAGLARQDGRGMAAIAAHLDEDNFVDLFVSNDICSNFVFLGNGDGTFRDVSAECGAGLSGRGRTQAGMGIDVADADGDGKPEILLTTYLNEMATLYRNDGFGFFSDVSESCGLGLASMPAVKWATCLCDFDNDTWPDIFITNGHTDDNLAELGTPLPYAVPPMFFRNEGGGRFAALSDNMAGRYFNQSHVGRGAAFGDLNNDGLVDIVVSHLDSPAAVLLNQSQPPNKPGPRHAWIGIQIVGTRSNRDGVGVRVEVELPNRKLSLQRTSGGSYFSSNDPRLLIGLGQAKQVEKLKLVWPSGAETVWERPKLNALHLAREPND